MSPALRQFITASVSPDQLPSGDADPPAPPLPRYGRPPGRAQIQQAHQAQRQARYDEVKTLASRGWSLRQIADQCRLSTHTVRAWIRTETLPPDRRGYRHGGKIDPFVDYLYARIAEGCTNQSRLWRELCDQGYQGTRSLVGKWMRRRRRGRRIG